MLGPIPTLLIPLLRFRHVTQFAAGVMFVGDCDIISLHDSLGINAAERAKQPSATTLRRDMDVGAEVSCFLIELPNIDIKAMCG
jgi:hypothetical protein